jgi:hypothetical protein
VFAGAASGIGRGDHWGSRRRSLLRSLVTGSRDEPIYWINDGSLTIRNKAMVALDIRNSRMKDFLRHLVHGEHLTHAVDQESKRSPEYFSTASKSIETPRPGPLGTASIPEESNFQGVATTSSTNGDPLIYSTILVF